MKEIVIRNARPEDGTTIAAVYAPYVKETPISFEETPPSGEEMAGRVRETIQRFPYLIAEESGRVVGYAYAGSHQTRASYRWSVNAAVYLAATHHRRGIGTLQRCGIRQLHGNEQISLVFLRQKAAGQPAANENSEHCDRREHQHGESGFMNQNA